MSSKFKDINKFCDVCNNKLILKASRDIERKKYCSHKCRSIALGKIMLEKFSNGTMKKPPYIWKNYIKKPDKFCKDCGIKLCEENINLLCKTCFNHHKVKEVHTLCKNCKIDTITAPHSIREFCIPKCRKEWKEVNGKKVIYNCAFCNKEFRKFASIITTDKPCCSRKCSFSFARLKPRTGKSYSLSLRKLVRRSIMYKDWRKNVRIKDNQCCTKCLCINNLHAHHIIPFAKLFKDFLEINKDIDIKRTDILFDLARKYEPFWDINNGQLLCENCHQNEHPETKLTISNISEFCHS